MPNTRVALLALSLTMAACSSSPPTKYEDPFVVEDIPKIPKPAAPSKEQLRRERLAKETPPATWAVGTIWRFTELDRRGKVVRTSVLRVTDKPSHPCISGNWRQLEVIEGDPKQLRAPAYEQEGRLLTVLLSTDMCDVYPKYGGEFVGDAFEGRYTASGLMFFEEFGAVRGEQVSPASK